MLDSMPSIDFDAFIDVFDEDILYKAIGASHHPE